MPPTNPPAPSGKTVARLPFACDFDAVEYGELKATCLEEGLDPFACAVNLLRAALRERAERRAALPPEGSDEVVYYTGRRGRAIDLSDD